MINLRLKSIRSRIISDFIVKLIQLLDASLTAVVPVVSLASANQLPGTSRDAEFIPNPLQFLTNFLPIPQAALTPEMLATVMQQQFSAMPAYALEPQIQSVINEDCSRGEEKPEPEFG
jgi:hypothetical protein